MLSDAGMNYRGLCPVQSVSCSNQGFFQAIYYTSLLALLYALSNSLVERVNRKDYSEEGCARFL